MPVKKTVIAEVKMAPGQTAYYDPLTRIYLTLAHPTAKVYGGMNVSQLKRSVRFGRLEVISGKLDPDGPFFRFETRNGKRVLVISNEPYQTKKVQKAAPAPKKTEVKEEVKEETKAEDKAAAKTEEKSAAQETAKAAAAKDSKQDSKKETATASKNADTKKDAKATNKDSDDTSKDQDRSSRANKKSTAKK